MRALLMGLSVLAAFLLIAVSAALNYRFMASFAHSAETGIMLGAAAVAGDILKASLPFFLVLAWQARRVLFLVLGAPAWALLTVVSLLAALGYAAEVRSDAAHVRLTRNAALELALNEARRLEQMRASQTERRTPAVIAEQLAALRQDARWTSSQDCTDATARLSRQYCADYFALRAALEAARTDADRDQDLVSLRREIARLRAAGGGLEAEPQVQVLAQLLGESAPRVRMVLIVLAALFLEVGSGLGLYLALHHSHAPVRTRKMLQTLPTDRTQQMQPVSRMADPLMAGQVMTPLGCMEAYWVARMVPAPGACLDTETAWQDYLMWCCNRPMAPLPRASFERLFWALAHDLRLSRSAAGVRGLALATLSDRAPLPRA